MASPEKTIAAAFTHGRESWNNVRVNNAGADRPRNPLRVLIDRWKQEGDEAALRVAAQMVFLSTVELSGKATAAAFDDLRTELGDLFLTAAGEAGDNRADARKLLASLLVPERGRGGLPSNAVIERDAIVRAYLHRASERKPPTSAKDRYAELENEVLPRANQLCGWPDDFKIDADTALRSVRSRGKPKSGGG